LNTPLDTFYSQNSLNEGNKQLLVFKIEELANTYILAWEDLDVTKWYSDGDFQDMIVRVKINVPEPSTLGLFGIGALALFVTRRQQKKGHAKV